MEEAPLAIIMGNGMGSVVNALWSPTSLIVLQPLASSMITPISAFLNRQID